MEFHFVIGTDLIPSLLKWDMGAKLISDINFVIYLRPGFEMDLTKSNPLVPANFLTIDPSFNILGMISSTEVRNRIKALRAKEEESKKQH